MGARAARTQPTPSALGLGVVHTVEKTMISNTANQPTTLAATELRALPEEWHATKTAKPTRAETAPYPRVTLLNHSGVSSDNNRRFG